MPWTEVSIMCAREEFVRLATQSGANKSELCRRFGISRPTGDKWIERWQEGQAMADRSRRPHHCPGRSTTALEHSVVQLREAHPAWGARKLHSVLMRRGVAVPCVSTVHAILQRHGLIEAQESAKHRAFVRFEHPRPNDLWQMDFKGHVGLSAGGRCHPLTVLDDHSRFSLCLQALPDERGSGVQASLRSTFRHYGLPRRMVMDNGAPWGNSPDHPYTPLGVWLMRLGIRVGHSRPYHPQTLGKDERFHRSLKAEVLGRRCFADLSQAQAGFDGWRALYNFERPHESLNMQVPAARYQISATTFPETLPVAHYEHGVHVRRVQQHGWISFGGHHYRVPKAFYGQSLGLRPNATRDGVVDVMFFQQCIAHINLLDHQVEQPVNHVPEHL
jgi:transposase InsO family protein